MPTVHSYVERHADSLRHDAVLARFYHKHFDGLSGIVWVGDPDLQKRGVDKILVRRDRTQILIEEKIRNRNYNDVLLEHTSNDRRGTPGWIAKELICDYLAYAVPSARICYLLPWPNLRRAWLLNGERWKRRYRPVQAVNEDGYTSHSTPVPLDVLREALYSPL